MANGKSKMTEPDYSPIRKEMIIKTEEGLINTLSRRYVTNRSGKEALKPYILIPASEIQMCKNEYVIDILVKIHKEKENLILKMPIDYIKYMEQEDINGTTNVKIPIKEMNIVGVEKK